MKLKTVIIFYEEAKPRKYRKVNSIEKLFEWLTKNGAGNWTAANIYDSKTKKFIEQIKVKAIYTHEDSKQ